MSLGLLQILLIALVVLVIFGAGRLPRVMGDLGKGIKAFKKGLKDDEKEQKDQESDTEN